MNEPKSIPNALEELPSVMRVVGRRTPVFFLDFDGTLAAIAPEPDQAVMSREMERVVEALADRYAVCLISGRALSDLRGKVGLRTVYFAADHGHRIVGPEGTGIDFEVTPENSACLETASYALEGALRDIPGVRVEIKDVSLAVHYRQVAPPQRPLVERVVAGVADATPGLRLTGGKAVRELVPETGWDKGKATVWILRHLHFGRREACPICLGDDLTDENMFRAVRNWGIAVVVEYADRTSLADYCLRDIGEVRAFLTAFLDPSAAKASR